MTLEPILPYNNPAPNSGWSGTDTSRDRAVSRDKSGRTATNQVKVLNLMDAAGTDGMTVAEMRDALPGDHHGTLSGCLSNLHKAGSISRLTNKRGGCKIYVLPSATYGRPTEAQGYVHDRTETP